jgi:hypothetical protein
MPVDAHKFHATRTGRRGRCPTIPIHPLSCDPAGCEDQLRTDFQRMRHAGRVSNRGQRSTQSVSRWSGGYATCRNRLFMRSGSLLFLNRSMTS